VRNFAAKIAKFMSALLAEDGFIVFGVPVNAQQSS